ncbi:MAG: diguanylate cyclase [Gammaproteobacteria bacterium]|nr:MAG: diguanylate cyclase [Gammaproteobacteria bacterium]
MKEHHDINPEDLSRLQVFQAVNLDTLSELLAVCSVKELEAGEVLIARNQTNAYLYLLLSGRLRVYLDTMGDAIAILEPGESVGEISLIDKHPTSAHVVAETHCKLFVVNEKTLWNMVSKSHAVAINLLTLLANRLRESNIKLNESQQRQQTLQYEASVDPLTGLYNRRWLDNELKQRIDHSLEIKQPVSILMIDIDHFKNYNDTHGHLAGDRALHAMGQALLNNLRPMDTAIRYGGEEFTVILPDTNQEVALQVADDLCSVVRAAEIRSPDGKQLPGITTSIGVAEARPKESTEALTKRADKALYKSKDAGRDQANI